MILQPDDLIEIEFICLFRRLVFISPLTPFISHNHLIFHTISLFSSIIFGPRDAYGTKMVFVLRLRFRCWFWPRLIFERQRLAESFDPAWTGWRPKKSTVEGVDWIWWMRDHANTTIAMNCIIRTYKLGKLALHRLRANFVSATLLLHRPRTEVLKPLTPLDVKVFFICTLHLNNSRHRWLFHWLN